MKDMAICICKRCGKLAEKDDICCGEEVVALDEAFDYQGKLFELTGNERAMNVLEQLKTIYSENAASVAKLEEKLRQAIRQRQYAADTLIDFYNLTSTEGTDDDR